LLEAFLAPAEAYLHSREGDYGKAEILLARALELDGELIRSSGFHELNAHRLQIACNVLRIHARRSNDAEAIAMGAALLAGLEQGSDPFADAGAPLAALPPELLDLYFDRVCGELSLLLAGRPPDAGLLAPLFAHGAPSEIGARGRSWLRLKAAAHLDEFWDIGVESLAGGCGPEPSLWFAGVIDVAYRCQRVGSEGETLADWMLSQAASHPDAPWRLRAPWK
jgi:hypothetical protein